MKRSHTLRIAPLALIAAATALAACDSDTLIAPGPPRAGAIVTFAFAARPADTLRVPVTDSATIAAAESYVRTRSGSKMLLGRILRGAGLDARYPFRFDSTSVRIVDFAIELCDGAPMRTSAEVDAFFRGSTGSTTADTTTWCPWSSYPVKVERGGA